MEEERNGDEQKAEDQSKKIQRTDFMKLFKRLEAKCQSEATALVRLIWNLKRVTRADKRGTQMTEEEER